MKRFLLCAAVAVFFWPYWAQQAPRIYYYPRPAGQPAVQYSCPNGRCCVGGRCGLAKPAQQKELPAPPKIAGDVPEVK